LDTPTSCRIELDGRSFAVPGDGDLLLEAIAALSSRFERITIDGPEDAPYRCVGGLIYAAQRAGMPIEFARPVLTRSYYVDGSAQIVRGHDANGDGRLSGGEWAAMARAAMAGGEEASNEEDVLAIFADTFGLYDLDRDQFVTADELATQYLHTFDCLDANRDGSLSGEEQRRGIEERCNAPDPRAAH
jgi:hypothetical protein